MWSRLDFQDKAEYEIYLKTYYAGLAMQGLLSKYKLNEPADQEIVCKLSVEVAETLVRALSPACEVKEETPST